MRDAAVLAETLRLSAQVGAATLASAWAQADAIALVRLAIREGAGAWLSRRLASLGIHLDPDTAAELASVARRDIAQSLRVDAEVVATLDLLASVGIERCRSSPQQCGASPVACPMPTHVRRATWTSSCARPKRAAPTTRCVRTAMRRRRTTVPAGHHHLPALAGALAIGVELHVSTSPAVAPAEAWRRATHDGARAIIGTTTRAIPSDTELLWHAATHAVADAADYARVGLRLRYWLDVAALLAAHAEIDWPRVRARLQPGEVRSPDAVRAWLRTASMVRRDRAAGASVGRRRQHDARRRAHDAVAPARPRASPARWTVGGAAGGGRRTR